MARGTSFRRTSAHGPRRQVSWLFGPSGSFGALSADSVVILPLGLQFLGDDLTIVRTRGELLLYVTVAGGAAGEGFTWAFGICVVNENAAGIGVTAIPAPFDDISWDGWMVHQQGQILTPEATLTGGDAEVDRLVIDSKAMRKTHATDVLVGVLQVTEIGAGSTMNSSFQSRVLVKLP